MRGLLDINVLLALFDADHVDHARTREWIGREIHDGWSSCAITQNGFLRVISQPRYPSPIPIAQAAIRLSRATQSDHHEFWPCNISLLDESKIDQTRVHGSRQVTDVYLLGLAVAHDGRFVTFDQSIPLEAIPGAHPANLVVL